MKDRARIGLKVVAVVALVFVLILFAETSMDFIYTGF